MLDGLKDVKMTGAVYLRAIVPIGYATPCTDLSGAGVIDNVTNSDRAFFSASLICSNQAYLYLSVAFIQMLKAVTPVAVLIASWILAVEEPNLRKLGNVSAIVIGVVIASYGEIEFRMIGFIFQAFGIAFEATRLVMVQRLLSGSEFKMDPLVSLYYFAPVCAVFNGLICAFVEGPRLSLAAIQDVGYLMLILNAATALCLNIAVVFLIGKTSSLVLTLSGVLKDILLVGASILIWGTNVAPLQFFGYSVALGGLVYYKLGAQGIKDLFGATEKGEIPRTKVENHSGPWKKITAVAVLVALGLFATMMLAGRGVSVPQEARVH